MFIIQLELIYIGAMSTSLQIISEAVLETWGEVKRKELFHLWIMQTRKRSGSRGEETM